MTETATIADIESFLAKISFTGNCWAWRGNSDERGYGRFFFGGVKEFAHRFSYTLFKGKIHEGLVIDHLCRNPDCVNPYHLEPVFSKENVARGIGVTAKNSQKTQCKHGHIFNSVNTYYYRRKSGTIKRQCKTCQNKSTKEYQRRILC